MAIPRFKIVIPVALVVLFFTVSADAMTFSKLLKRGSRGAEVVELQKFLNANNFNAGTADGAFGPRTRSAVMAWQASVGLSADGVVGPMSRAKLNAMGGQNAVLLQLCKREGSGLSGSEYIPEVFASIDNKYFLKRYRDWYDGSRTYYDKEGKEVIDCGGTPIPVTQMKPQCQSFYHMQFSTEDQCKL